MVTDGDITLPASTTASQKMSKSCLQNNQRYDLIFTNLPLYAANVKNTSVLQPGRDAYGWLIP